MTLSIPVKGRHSVLTSKIHLARPGLGSAFAQVTLNYVNWFLTIPIPEPKQALNEWFERCETECFLRKSFTKYTWSSSPWASVPFVSNYKHRSLFGPIIHFLDCSLIKGKLTNWPNMLLLNQLHNNNNNTEFHGWRLDPGHYIVTPNLSWGWVGPWQFLFLSGEAFLVAFKKAGLWGISRTE